MSGLPTLEQQLGRALAHPVLLVCCILLGTAAGFGLVRLDQPLTTARASVFMSELPSYVPLDPGAKAPDDVTVDTDAVLLRSTEVTDAVAAATGVDPAEVQDHLGVTATPMTPVLHVSFSAPTADAATTGATTAAKTLLRQRATLLAGAARTSLERLRSELAEVRDQVKRNVDRLGDSTVPSPDEVLLSRLQFLVRFLDQVRSGNQSMGQLLSEARTVGPPSTVNPEVKLSGGGMVGLLAGLGLGLCLDAWRGRRRQWSP